MAKNKTEIPNEIQVTHVKIGESYKIDYDKDGINYKFIGKIANGSIMNDGRVWIDFNNIQKYWIDGVLIYQKPKIIFFVYLPNPYIPDANDVRVYKLIHGSDANIMDSIKPFKLNYIKEFPYETTVNFQVLPTDINREIRSYII
jgi:hypothetical protein